MSIKWKSLFLPFIPLIEPEITNTGNQLIGLGHSPAAIPVGEQARLTTLDPLQQGREYAPGLGELVGAHEMDLAAAEDVQNEALIGLRQVNALVALAVGQVQFGGLGLEVHARPLGHELEVDGLVGLHADHELVAVGLAGEDVAGHVLELDAHFGFALVQGLAALHDEGHT